MLRWGYIVRVDIYYTSIIQLKIKPSHMGLLGFEMALKKF